MSRLIDMTGEIFGKLLIIKRDWSKGTPEAHWKCLCDCGNTTIVGGYNLRTGITKSCGCLKLTALRTHGMSDTRFYHIWESMIQRCENPNNPGYKEYGGKGIKVSDNWKDFINFKEDMLASYEDHVRVNGESETTIDRVNGAEGYSKGNCRWATKSLQNFNRIPATFIEGKVMGVNQVKTTGKWYAGITVNHKYNYLGTFEDKRDAIKARKEAEIYYFGGELVYPSSKEDE